MKTNCPRLNRVPAELKRLGDIARQHPATGYMRSTSMHAPYNQRILRSALSVKSPSANTASTSARTLASSSGDRSSS